MRALSSVLVASKLRSVDMTERYRVRQEEPFNHLLMLFPFGVLVGVIALAI